MTTPQQIVKCLLSYAKRNPAFYLSSFFLPQIAGSRPPSRRVDGVSEAFVRSKKYIVPLAAFHPWAASAILAVYLAAGRFNVAHYATTMYTPHNLSALQDSSPVADSSGIDPTLPLTGSSLIRGIALKTH